MNKYVRNFLFILGAGLVSAIIGSIFAIVITKVSPEFAFSLFHPKTDSITRYSAAIGMIWGLFVGASAMAFVIFVAAIANWFKSGKKINKS